MRDGNNCAIFELLDGWLPRKYRWRRYCTIGLFLFTYLNEIIRLKIYSGSGFIQNQNASFFSRARAKQINWRWPTLRFWPRVEDLTARFLQKISDVPFPELPKFRLPCSY